MPRGAKSKYTEKQQRKAEHIEEGYESRGVPENEAERRAWATVNKDDGGGKRVGGSGRGTRRQATPPRTRADGSAALRRPRDRRQAGLRRPEKPRRHGGATRRARAN